MWLVEIINVVNSHKECELCWGPNFFLASGRGWVDPGVIGPYKTMHVQLRFMLINSAYYRLVTKHSTMVKWYPIQEKSSDIYTWNQTKHRQQHRPPFAVPPPSLPTPPSIIRPTPGYPALNALAKVWANFFSQFWKKDLKETAVWNVYWRNSKFSKNNKFNKNCKL